MLQIGWIRSTVHAQRAIMQPPEPPSITGYQSAASAAPINDTSVTNATDGNAGANL